MKLRERGDQDLLAKYGSGSHDEVSQLSNKELSEILVLCNVPLNIAQRCDHKKRIELVKKIGSHAPAAEDGGHSRPTVVNTEQLLRDFEADLSIITEEGAGAAEGDEDSSDELGKDIENFLHDDDQNDAAASSSSSAKSSGSGARGKARVAREGKRKVIKRQLDFINPDGSRWRRYELITDPTEVHRYIQRQESNKKRRARNIEQHEKTCKQLKHARDQRKRRNKDQDAADQLSEIEKKQQNLEKYEQWIQGGKQGQLQIGPRMTQRVCSVCGAHGHMKTNTICPLYNEEDMVSKKKPKQRRQVQETQGTKLMVRSKPAPTLKITKKKIMAAKSATKARRQRKQHSQFGDGEIYQPKTTRVRGARGTAYQRWCDLIEHSIMEKLEQYPDGHFFWNPVSKKDAPDYRALIQKPLCLRQIRDVLRKHGYATKDLFLQDMSLVFDNCVQYNSGPNKGQHADEFVVGAAEAVRKYFNDLMAQHQSALTALEQEVTLEQSAPTLAAAWSNVGTMSPSAASAVSPGFSPAHSPTFSSGFSPAHSPTFSSDGGSPGMSGSFGSPGSPGISPGYSSSGQGSPRAAEGAEDGNAVYSSEEEEPWSSQTV